MAKTGKQIQSDVLALLKSSTLPSIISGKVYRKDCRPRDSKAEDAIVIFTTGLPGQIQTGVVTINIYCPDIDPYENGVLVEDGQRCETLEKAAADWVNSLTAAVSNYKFKLQQTIYTEEEPEIQQHFIVVKLQYEYID
jgi:hypothetical protein